MSETEEKQAPEKFPCSGCAFSYTVSVKGLIRKHNSRTGPGLCDGAQKPPKRTAGDIANDFERANGGRPPCGAAVGSGVCDKDAGHGGLCAEPEDTALPVPVMVDPDCPNDPENEREHCVQGACTGCCGCSSMCTTDPCGQPVTLEYAAGSPVTPEEAGLPASQEESESDDPFLDSFMAATGIIPGESVRVMHQKASAVYGCQNRKPCKDCEPLPDPADPARVDVMAAVAKKIADHRERYLASQPDPFTAPAPVSDIPDGSVSQQPEPDRDRWGRYVVQGTAHTRATTFAKSCSDTFSLSQWGDRMVVRGLTLRPDLLALAHGLDVKQNRKDLNSIAEQAKEAAGQKVAANLGSAYHAFSERLDAGLMKLEDVPETYRGRLAEYLAVMQGAGLTTRPEWIERTTAVRADQVGEPVAGTLDRIVRLPNGELVIADLKTGSDLSYGWGEIAVQLALYAHGVNTHGLFDWRTKQWQQMNHLTAQVSMVRTDYAIVMHLPADKEGCTLYRVDIEAGWEYARLCGHVRAFRKNKQLARPLELTDIAVPLDVPVTQMPQGEVAQAAALWKHAVSLIRSAASGEALVTLVEQARESGRFPAHELDQLQNIAMEQWDRLATPF